MQANTSGNRALISFPMVILATIFFIAADLRFLSGFCSSSRSSGTSPGYVESEEGREEEGGRRMRFRLERGMPRELPFLVVVKYLMSLILDPVEMITITIMVIRFMIIIGMKKNQERKMWKGGVNDQDPLMESDYDYGYDYEMIAITIIVI